MPFLSRCAKVKLTEKEISWLERSAQWRSEADKGVLPFLFAPAAEQPTLQVNDWPPVVNKNLVHIESIDVGVIPLVSSHFARGVNAAGDRVRVERESLLAGQAHGDAAGGGREPPGALAFALHQDVAAGGLGAHGAVTPSSCSVPEPTLTSTSYGRHAGRKSCRCVVRARSQRVSSTACFPAATSKVARPSLTLT